jgi:hypothetical protein
MEWQRLVVAFEASLALILILRLWVLPVTSVRRMLLFLLLPTIAAPIFLLLPAKAVDIRSLWISSRAFGWICRVAVVYAFLSVAFAKHHATFLFLRRIWTVALAATIVTAISQTPSSSRLFDLDSLTTGALTFERGISALIGFVLLSLLAFLLWSRVRLSKNVAAVGIGAVLTVGVQVTMTFLGGRLPGNGGRWIYGSENVLWIACLGCWILFLSRSGEVNDSACFLDT